MQPVKFVYFDVGGTLIDFHRFFTTPATEFGIDKDALHAVFMENIEAVTKGSMTSQELWDQCIKRYGLKNAQKYNFAKAWVADYTAINEMHELLKKCKSRYNIGLLSNIYSGMYPYLISGGLIPDIKYDAIVFSCDVGMMKPDEEIYHYAQEKAHVKPKEILFIDDRQDFLGPAEKLGWNTFLFDNKNVIDSIRKLEKYA